MAKNNYHIQSSKRNAKQIYDQPPKPCIYKGSDYGLASTLTGKGVKIAIIDTGVPDHVDIRNIIEGIDLSDSTRDNSDHHGHSTMVSGILTAKNNNAVTGISPNAELYFAKVSNQSGECSFGGIVAGILWAIVKEVDVLLISLGSQTNYSVLHDAVRKAYEHNICIFAASGNERDGELEYPASYPEVLSVGRYSLSSKASKFQVLPASGLKMVVPDTDIYTTYLHGRYTKSGGSSLAAALGAGLASLLIEKSKLSNGKKMTPNELYAEMGKLAYRNSSQK